MAREKLGAYNVVAVFPTLEQARQALLNLERTGIDASNISVLGRHAERAEDVSAHDTSSADTGIMGDTMSGAAAGATAGTAIGGIAGFVAGALAFAIPGVGPAIGTGVWLATIGGAVAGAGLGGYLGMLSKLPVNPDADITYEDAVQQGKVVVAANLDDPADLEKARGAIEAARPLRVDTHDAEGRALGLSYGGQTGEDQYTRT